MGSIVLQSRARGLAYFRLSFNNLYAAAIAFPPPSLVIFLLPFRAACTTFSKVLLLEAAARHGDIGHCIDQPEVHLNHILEYTL